MLQSLDEWLQVSNDILGRMGELSVTSIDGSKSQEDRANAQLEFIQLSDELEGISYDAKHNGINVASAGQSKVEPLDCFSFRYIDNPLSKTKFFKEIQSMSIRGKNLIQSIEPPSSTITPFEPLIYATI